MKIAIFTNLLDVRSGTGNIAHELCQKLKGKVDFTLFAPKNEAQCHYNYVDYPVQYILPQRIVSFKNRRVLDYLFLPKIENFREFDIVHSLFAFPYCITAARLAEKHRQPLIIGTQGTFAITPLLRWPQKMILEWSYNKASVITAPSEFTKKSIQKFSKTKTKADIRVIHNGVNFSRFQKELDIQTLKEKYKNKIILFEAGALKRRKGQDLVIKALAKIKPIYPNAHFLIAGDGSLKSDLEKLVKRLNLENNVVFLGVLAGQELVKYFQLCDIYVHPARNVKWHFEGFGIVYLEAGACHKPVIAARSGGVPDAVIADKTGLMVEENDADGLAKAMVKLIENENLRKELGENGFEYAKKHDWSIIAEEYLKLYESVCQHK